MPTRQRSHRKRANSITREEFDTMTRWFFPLPDPAQRWNDAVRLAKAKPSERYSSSSEVTAAIEYLTALESCETDDARAALRSRWPHLAQARAIYDANTVPRWELEAYILSGESNEEVAARLGLSPRTVATYVLLFFDLRAYIAEPEWLIGKMFPGFTLKFQDHQLREFWAWVGLWGGPILLRRHVAEFRAAWQPHSAPLLRVYLREDAPVSLNSQAFVASFLLPGNTKTVPIIFETHLGLIEAERESDPARQKELIDQLKRTMIAFTRGYLSGKTAEELLCLLRYPPSLDRVRAKMRAMGDEGRIALCDFVARVKSSPLRPADSPELDDLLRSVASGSA